MTPRRLRVFPAISRNRDPKKYVDELMRVAQFADRNGFEGILLFEGNDVFVEPWAMAQHIIGETTRSSPLIAVNPVYMHPFTAAKFVSSFAQLHGRKVYLNMITGTAVSDLQGLGDEQSHADRYVRLGEFVALMRQLLASPRPTTFRGPVLPRQQPATSAAPAAGADAGISGRRPVRAGTARRKGDRLHQDADVAAGSRPRPRCAGHEFWNFRPRGTRRGAASGKGAFPR
ncbi:alkanesulfonate monooxygenase SsuD/methylene tetrahydromethanopterin reductase-like flavin-dependent oxidoreductase (luciferase family) [Bradyrhizobium sp. GM0.4]